MKSFLEKKQFLIDGEKEILSSCSYEKWLKKGFVIIKNSSNQLVKRAEKLKENQDINIKFLDGNAKAKVSKIIEIGPGKILSGLISRITNKFDIINIDKIEDLDKFKN